MFILGAPVFIIGGSPKVGKSSLAAKLSKELNCPLLSFGDHVRARARILLGNVAPTRYFLQDLGQELVSQDPETFCREVLSSAVLSRKRPVVIDGLRHMSLLPFLSKLLDGRELNVIFVEASPEARIKRWGAEITRLELTTIDTHPVEAGMAQIREHADLVVDTQTGFSEAYQKILQWITRAYPSVANSTVPDGDAFGPVT